MAKQGSEFRTCLASCFHAQNLHPMGQTPFSPTPAELDCLVVPCGGEGVAPLWCLGDALTRDHILGDLKHQNSWYFYFHWSVEIYKAVLVSGVPQSDQLYTDTYTPFKDSFLIKAISEY